MTELKTREKWLHDISEVLVGRTIKSARYMSKEEVKSNMWYKSAVVLTLDDGNIIYPMADDGANDAGAIGTSYDKLLIIPTLRT